MAGRRGPALRAGPRGSGVEGEVLGKRKARKVQAQVGKEPRNPAETSTMGPALSEAAGRRKRPHVPPPSLQSAQKNLMPTAPGAWNERVILFTHRSPAA